VIPVSFAQRRLWFLAQVEGSSATYNIPVVVGLSGPLDIAALRSALTDVTGRHESLRTVFPMVDGNPEQRVLPVADALHRLHFEHLAVAPAAMDSAISSALGSVFDLSCDIPIRAWVFSATDLEQVLGSSCTGCAIGSWWTNCWTALNAAGARPSW